MKIIIFLLIIQSLTETTFPYFPENIGYPPNDSNYIEASPVISADGKTIYFTSDRPAGVGLQDIWFSKFENGRWTKPENLGPPVNSPTSDGVMCLTSDELVMYFASHRKPSFGNADIFMCKKINGKWQEVKNLGSKVNSAYFESYPSIAPDGKRLFFVSNRPGGFGENDIYVTTFTENEWSEPINLGPNVNSPYNEIFPYMLWDGVTLFFASNREGKYRLYKTILQDDGSFSPCERVDFIPTTFENVFSFSIPASGEYAYLTIGDEKGNYDIYKVRLPENMRPKKAVVMIEGMVTDRIDGKPIKGAQVIIENLTTGEVFSSTITDSTGKYKFALPAGFLYGVTITAEGYLFSSTHLDLTHQESYEELLEASKLSPVKKGEKIVLRNIFFDFNKATLRKESILELNRVVEIMKKYPSIIVEIAGHTDDIGSDEYNMKLSIERANAVVNYLITHGIESKRLIAKGYGKTRPLVPNIDEKSRQLNRRVEFKIIEKEDEKD
mgnify:CR=1 FL=1